MGFRPGLVPTAMVIACLPLLVALGTWQVQRLAWKTELIATLQSRGAAPAQALPDTPALSPEWEHRQVAVAGTFAAAPALRFGVAQRQGRPGHAVLQRMRLADGRDLVVNRGWVPADTTAPPTPDGAVPVAGVLRWVADDVRRWPVPANEPSANRWYWYDHARLEQAFGATLLPVVLVQATPAPTPIPGAPMPQPVVVDLPNNHLGYAVTWYGLAVALLAVYVAYGLKRGSEQP